MTRRPLKEVDLARFRRRLSTFIDPLPEWIDDLFFNILTKALTDYGRMDDMCMKAGQQDDRWILLIAPVRKVAMEVNIQNLLGLFHGIEECYVTANRITLDALYCGFNVVLVIDLDPLHDLS